MSVSECVDRRKGRAFHHHRAQLTNPVNPIEHHSNNVPKDLKGTFIRYKYVISIYYTYVIILVEKSAGIQLKMKKHYIKT